MTYIPHDQQRIQGDEAKAMAEPLRKTVEYLTSDEGREHVKQAANEIKKEIMTDQQNVPNQPGNRPEDKVNQMTENKQPEWETEIRLIHTKYFPLGKDYCDCGSCRHAYYEELAALLTTQRDRELWEKLEDMKVIPDSTMTNVYSQAEGYNQAISDIQQLLNQKEE